MGYLDDVIDPVDTRPRLIAGARHALDQAAGLPQKKHGNPPL
jgi:acetyl-CoA carboxylase carboxyltransferase component